MAVVSLYALIPARLNDLNFQSFGRGSVGSSFNIDMYTVYVLKSFDNKIYKDVTNNLERRLREHLSGHTITTSKMNGLRIVYSEQYDNFIDARNREVYFKSAAGRRFLKNKI